MRLLTKSQRKDIGLIRAELAKVKAPETLPERAEIRSKANGWTRALATGQSFDSPWLAGAVGHIATIAQYCSSVEWWSQVDHVEGYAKMASDNLQSAIEHDNEERRDRKWRSEQRDFERRLKAALGGDA